MWKDRNKKYILSRFVNCNRKVGIKRKEANAGEAVKKKWKRRKYRKGRKKLKMVLCGRI
jgi:hypothetical protein